MDLPGSNNRLSIRVSQLVPPPMQSSTPSVPIIAIAVIGIVGTAFLLVSYYVFVIKCCLSWHRVDDVLSRFSLSRRQRNHDHPNYNNNLVMMSPEARGLDEAAIRSIPILNFKNRGVNSSRDYGERGFCECAVCLNEFQEDEKLRFIPQCGHVFHIDCIDIWLHNNANCPLCRTSVSGATHLALFDLKERVSGPNYISSSSSSSNAVIRSEQDYVVLELGEPSRNLLPEEDSIAHTPRKTTTKKKKKMMMMFHQTSMGDEVIGTTREEEEERILPIRRSFSMDSAGDRQLFVAVQEIMQQKRQFSGINNSPAPAAASDSARLIRRTFFSFGNGGGSRDRSLSRSAVQPLCLDQDQQQQQQQQEP